MVTALLEAYDREDRVVVIYLDIVKGFDSVPHQRLLAKLQIYGIIIIISLDPVLPTNPYQKLSYQETIYYLLRIKLIFGTKAYNKQLIDY